MITTIVLAVSFRFASTFPQTYGPLAGVVALLLWTYLSALAIFYGVAVAAELEATAATSASQERTTNPALGHPGPRVFSYSCQESQGGQARCSWALKPDDPASALRLGRVGRAARQKGFLPPLSSGGRNPRPAGHAKATPQGSRQRPSAQLDRIAPDVPQPADAINAESSRDCEARLLRARSPASLGEGTERAEGSRASRSASASIARPLRLTAPRTPSGPRAARRILGIFARDRKLADVSRFAKLGERLLWPHRRICENVCSCRSRVLRVRSSGGRSSVAT